MTSFCSIQFSALARLDLRLVLEAGPTCLFKGQGPHSKEKLSVLMLRLALEPNLEYWSRCSFQGPKHIKLLRVQSFSHFEIKEIKTARSLFDRCF